MMACDTLKLISCALYFSPSERTQNDWNPPRTWMLTYADIARIHRTSKFILIHFKSEKSSNMIYNDLYKFIQISIHHSSGPSRSAPSTGAVSTGAHTSGRYCLSHEAPEALPMWKPMCTMAENWGRTGRTSRSILSDDVF